MVNGSGTGRLLSAKDLSDAGLATVDAAGNITAVTTYVATPPAPTGVTATAAVNTVIVEWDAVTYNGFAYAEVWGASSNNIALAVLLGQTPGFIYTDPLGPGATRYYWVRFVNTNDQVGPYNAVSGVSATTAQDLAYTMDVLAAAYGDTSEAPFFQLNTSQVIGGVTIPAGTYMKAGFIYDGVITNAKIANAAIDSAKIASASITTAKIADANITTAKIADANISTAKIANAAITTALIADANISTAKIANAAITTALIADANITSAKIADANITNAKIANAAITTAKIGDAQITTAKIGDGEITNAKIGDTIQSTGFVSGSTGWRIQKTGAAEFNDVVISRQLQVDSGSYALGYVDDNGGNGTLHELITVYVETNTSIASWGGTGKSYMASVSWGGSVYAFVSSVTNFPQNIMWGAKAEIVPLTRWSGAARLWLKITVTTRYVDYLDANTILYWNIYEVT
jgi:hypothetical protein